MTTRLKRAIDTELSGLRMTQSERTSILENALEGKKVKKKLSVAFVLVMMMVLVAAVALALITIQETGRFIAQTEQENGDYINWPADKKATVVCELMTEGFIDQTSERKQLYDQSLSQSEKERIADEAIAQFTGEEVRHANFLSIMNMVWGPFSQWSNEQQAWYSQVMSDVGAETDGKTYYVTQAGSISEEEALAIAKKEIARGFGLEESLMEKLRVVEVSFQVPEFAEKSDRKAYWYVCLDTWQTDLEGQDNLPFAAIDVFVDPETGELLEAIEDKVGLYSKQQARRSHPLVVAINAFEKAVNEPMTFLTWKMENKARWSSEIVPQMKVYLPEQRDELEDLLGYVVTASAYHTYGLPDEKAITQEKALAISREVLQATYSLCEEELSLLFDNGLSFDAPAVFYDVSDPERPLWKFVLTMPSVYCSDDQIAQRVKALYGSDTEYDQVYKVELNAYTGEVVRVLSMRYMPDTLEGYIEQLY